MCTCRPSHHTNTLQCPSSLPSHPSIVPPPLSITSCQVFLSLSHFMFPKCPSPLSTCMDSEYPLLIPMCLSSSLPHTYPRPFLPSPSPPLPSPPQAHCTYIGPHSDDTVGVLLNQLRIHMKVATSLQEERHHQQAVNVEALEPPWNRQQMLCAECLNHKVFNTFIR